MESLSLLYSILPVILNSLLSDKTEDALPHHLLTEKVIELCSKINKNNMPMSYSRLKKITTTDFKITLESLIVSAYFHYKDRVKQSPCDNENAAYIALVNTMKTLQIKTSNPDVLAKIPRTHVLKVLFNINLINNKLVA